MLTMAVRLLPRGMGDCIQGWKRNILDRIKMVFGFGVPEFH
jgi:hypothetical protein